MPITDYTAMFVDQQYDLIKAEKNNATVLEEKATMWEQTGNELGATAEAFQAATNRADAAYGGVDGDAFVARSRESHGTMVKWHAAIQGSGAPAAMRAVAKQIPKTLFAVGEMKGAKNDALAKLAAIQDAVNAAGGVGTPYVVLESHVQPTVHATTPGQIEKFYAFEAGTYMNALGDLYMAAGDAVEKANANVPWTGVNDAGGPPGGPTSRTPGGPPGGGPSGQDPGQSPGAQPGGGPAGGDQAQQPGGGTGGAPAGGAGGAAPGGGGGAGAGGAGEMPPGGMPPGGGMPSGGMPELSGGTVAPTLPPPGSTLTPPTVPPVGGLPSGTPSAPMPPFGGLGGLGGVGGGVGGGAGGLGGGVGGGGAAGARNLSAAAGPVVSPNNPAPARTAPVPPPIATPMSGSGGGTGGVPPMMPPPMGGHGMGAGGQNGNPPGSGAAKLPITNRGSRRGEGTPGLPTMLAGRSGAPSSNALPAAAPSAEDVPASRDIVDEDLWQVAENSSAAIAEPRRVYR